MGNSDNWQPATVVNHKFRPRGAPSACVLGPNIYLMWRQAQQDVHEPDMMLYSAARRGVPMPIWNESGSINKPGDAAGEPRAGVFQGGLLAFFLVSVDSGTVNFTPFQNGQWQEPKPAGFAISLAPPSDGCVFNGTTYDFTIRPGQSEASGPIQYIYYDPGNPRSFNGWAGEPPGTINAVDSSRESPSPVVFEDHRSKKPALYLFWRSASGQSIFYSRSTDGRQWPPGTEILFDGQILSDNAPAACVCKDRLYLFFRFTDNTIRYSTSSDGVEWGKVEKIDGAETDESPAVVVSDEGTKSSIYVFWRALDGSLKFSGLDK